MLTFRRKLNSGKMFMQSREGGHKSRQASLKTLYPGDIMKVARKEDLPGWPHSMDGWELIDGSSEPNKSPVPNPKKDYMGVGECLEKAVLEAVRLGSSNRWKVIIKEPGLDHVTQDKLRAVLPVGTKIHPGYLSQTRAEAWAKAGYDPGE